MHRVTERSDFCVCVTRALSSLPVATKEICCTQSTSKCSTFSREHPSSPAMGVLILCAPQRKYQRVPAAPSASTIPRQTKWNLSIFWAGFCSSHLLLSLWSSRTPYSICIDIHFKLSTLLTHFALYPRSPVSLQSLHMVSLSSLPPLIRETIFTAAYLWKDSATFDLKRLPEHKFFPQLTAKREIPVFK